MEVIGCLRAVCPDKGKCSTERKCQNPMHADPGLESVRSELMRFSKEELVTELLGALVELASRGPVAPPSRS
jgi:hypothetical protein